MESAILAKLLLQDFARKDRGNLTRDEYRKLIAQELEEWKEERKQAEKDFIKYITKSAINKHGKSDKAKRNLQELFQSAGFSEQWQKDEANRIWSQY